MEKYYRTWRYFPDGSAKICETQEEKDKAEAMGAKDTPAAFAEPEKPEPPKVEPKPEAAQEPDFENMSRPEIYRLLKDNGIVVDYMKADKAAMVAAYKAAKAA